MSGREGVRRRCRRLAQGAHDVRAARQHLVATRPPGVGDRVEDLQQLGLREVGAAEERLPLRRHQHRHRPPALAGQRLGGGHVDRVDVGTLLAVDLDRDVPVVEDPGHLGVLERLVGHDVAPVARGVPDREEHGDVAPGGLRERLRLPLPPVDRVVAVLQQVRAGRGGQTVGHTRFSPSRTTERVSAAGRGRPRRGCCAGHRSRRGSQGGRTWPRRTAPRRPRGVGERAVVLGARL